MTRPYVSSAKPLSRSELDTFLQALFHDPVALPHIGVEAFAATAMGLYDFCDADDVDAALLAIPRERGSVRPIAHA